MRKIVEVYLDDRDIAYIGGLSEAARRALDSAVAKHRLSGDGMHYSTAPNDRGGATLTINAHVLPKPKKFSRSVEIARRMHRIITR